MQIQVISIYAAVLALLYIALALRVVNARRIARIGLGAGEDRRLEQTIRAHANCSEYIPLALILLLMLEQTPMPLPVLHIAGILLVAGRAIHAWGLNSSAGTSFGRYFGTLFTWLVIVFAALSLLWFSLLA